ncbi:MAG: hypothetical protein AB1813_11515, partial [Verrucomicrobiota bacterium]
YVSASGMRTGRLHATDDKLSELWFGNGFVRAIGRNATKFEAHVFEGDVQFFWPSGHFKGAGGYLSYDDNDPADQSRDVYYFYLEGKQRIADKLYGAVRFSEVLAPEGFPIVGNGDFGLYQFGRLTRRLWRLSTGLGYELSPSVLLKTEFSLDDGRELSGAPRHHENMFSIEAAVKF